MQTHAPIRRFYKPIHSYIKRNTNYETDAYSNYTGYILKSRSQWPRGLRRKSAAARLLRLWVRIPPGAWMFIVSVVCFQVEVSATS